MSTVDIAMANTLVDPTTGLIREDKILQPTTSDRDVFSGTTVKRTREAYQLRKQLLDNETLPKFALHSSEDLQSIAVYKVAHAGIFGYVPEISGVPSAIQLHEVGLYNVPNLCGVVPIPGSNTLEMFETEQSYLGGSCI